jgi:Tfp pilus assembly protein PilV
MRVSNKIKFLFKRGFMMVEILIVASIIVVTVLAAMNVAEKAIYLSRQSVHQSQASFLLEEGAEAVRILRDNAWSNISSLTIATNYYPTFSGGTWTLSLTPNTVGIFTRKVVVSSAYRDGNQDLATSGTLDDQIRLVTVTVSWMDGGKTFSKTLQFYLADIFS